MDQQVAQRLLAEGATFVLLDIPLGSEFGIDVNTYRIGEKFRGVKMIPPGLHFIHYSALSNYDQKTTGPRTGFFHLFTEREMMVKRWDPRNEDISDQEPDGEEVDRLRANLMGSLDQHLAAYPYETYKKWIGLTDFVSETVVNALNPKCGKITSVTHMIAEDADPVKVEPCTSTNPEQLLPKMKADPNCVINFVEMPKQRHPDGSTPSQITKYNIDSSYLFEQIVSRFQDRNYILAEFQFAFVVFLCGQVYDGFERWKTLLKILCTSDEAITKYPDVFTNFIRVLYFQLQEVPSDLFVDIVEKDNLLVMNLHEFFSNISFEHIDENLRKRANKFKGYITQKFKWDFDREPDDEAPVVVDI